MEKNPLHVLSNSSELTPWYHQGLSFKCTQCGQCCTGAPGYTWVSDEEIKAIASYLKVSVEDFVSRYLKKVGDRWSLREHPKNYDCVFLKDNKCDVYSVRPKQCQTFPWWPRNLRSSEDWKEAAVRCEGINPNAPTVPFDEIQAVLESQIK